MLLSTSGGTIFTVFVEELLIRGSVFRLGEELLGTWAALLLSAVLYGAIIRLTPGTSAWSTTAITLEVDVLLGATIVVTERI